MEPKLVTEVSLIPGLLPVLLRLGGGYREESNWRGGEPIMRPLPTEGEILVHFACVPLASSWVYWGEKPYIVQKSAAPEYTVLNSADGSIAVATLTLHAPQMPKSEETEDAEEDSAV